MEIERASGINSLRVVAAALLVFGIAACGVPALMPTTQQTPKPEGNLDLIAAERFIDAFYAWNADSLAATMDTSQDSARTLYYQAWAEAGNYQIQKRRPCVRREDGVVECAITVTDDIGETLGYVATDTFRLSIGARRKLAVEFASDDPPAFEEVFEWMSVDRPQVFAGPCKDMFNGGTTPALCARAVVQAARDFANRSQDQH